MSLNAKTSKGVWAGRIISGLCVLFLVVDSVMKLMRVAPVLEANSKLGYPVDLAVPLGIILLTCTIVYAIPQVSVLGAILLTAYLGGATATHVRIGDPFYFPVVFGVFVWLGLYLRDERVRWLIPLRK